MKILALTRYSRRGASSRLRTYQYLPHLRSSGLHVDIAPLFGDDHLEAFYSAGRPSPVHVLGAYVKRIASIARATNYDLIWLEKELLPFVPALFERAIARIPYLVDYDDALFHRYDGHPNPLIRAALGGKIAAVMRRAACVTAGNEYLADYARRAGAPRVEIIPTVVDLDRYPHVPDAGNDVFTVGWIGTPVTTKYLHMVEEPLRRLSETGPLRFVVVGADIKMDGVDVDCRPWSEETEVEAISRFDAGIMPLPDTPWERGKCGYKLIQYMACGKPVVASPVGVNASLVDHGRSGFLAGTAAEWEQSLATLRGARRQRAEMGSAGRRLVADRFCLERTAPRLISIFETAAGGSSR